MMKVNHSSQVETLQSTYHLKNPIGTPESVRVCINHIASDRCALAVSSTRGLGIADMDILKRSGEFKIMYKSSPNGAQSDPEVSQSIFIPGTSFIVFSSSDGTLTCKDYRNESSDPTQLKFKSPCLSLCLIPSQESDTVLLACGTQSSRIHIVKLRLGVTSELSLVTTIPTVVKQNALSFGVNHISYDVSTFSLYAGVSRIGVFKWLYCNTEGS